jgi:hypothetical protein
MTALNSPLDRLQYCVGIEELKEQLHVICAPYGRIQRLDVLRAQRSGKRQAICLWRMESCELEEDVISELGVGRFGGDLVAVVELQPSSGRVPGSGWGDLQTLPSPLV